MKIETHCHSYHSFDSSAKIEDIVNECINKGIKAITINDHDVYNITDNEEKLFKNNNIKLVKAIEFTTSEGIHIIGINSDIKKFQKEPFYYSAVELIDILKQNECWIILPHPYHETGIIGNNNISDDNSIYCLSNSHFIEKNNYRYGISKGIDIVLEQYKNLKPLVGSDAHKVSDIGIFYNEITNEGKDLFNSLYNSQYTCVITKEKTNFYFFKRKIKKTKVYQFFLNQFSPEVRIKIKKKLRLI